MSNKIKTNESVGGDIFANGSDRNVTNNSEIETGPVTKSFNDKSDYEEGIPPTTDKVTSRYRQDIPWFAVYSYGSKGYVNSKNISENNRKYTKKQIEEKIEDLVNKSEFNDIIDKNENKNIKKIISLLDTLNSDEQKIVYSLIKQHEQKH